MHFMEPVSLCFSILTVTIVVFLGLSLLQVIVPPDMHTCLPDTYTSIPAVPPTNKDPPVPVQEGPNTIECKLISDAMENEYK